MNQTARPAPAILDPKAMFAMVRYRVGRTAVTQLALPQ